MAEEQAPPDLRYLPAFELSNSLRRDIEFLKPVETRFVHYTSLDAFYSIMDSARIRFSSAKSTNDPSEFFFGLEVVRKGLQLARAEARPSETSVIDQCLDEIGSRQFKAFAFCMSEVVDDEAEVGDLNQWRLYGADGRGIALIIDITNQAKRDELISFTSIPRKVVYGEVEGSRFVKDQIQDFFNNVPGLPLQTREYLDENPSAYSSYLGNILFWLPSVIKHKAYRQEREVRLIRGDVGEHAGNPLVFYENGTIRRPCIELPISRQLSADLQNRHSSPISKVIIGPSGDQSAIEDSIRFFLEARNWDLAVCRSDIPYRAV